MPDYKLKIITPWFLNGPAPRSPELRAASVRGQLRYWFRAIEGARGAGLAQLWEQESNIFGSTGGGSSVSIRLYLENRHATLQTDSHPMLPHRNNERERSYQRAIEPGQSLILEAVTRPGIKLSARFRSALEVWLLLGGIGKRSRRMFGAINSSSFWPALQSSPEQLAEDAKKRLGEIIPEPSPLPGIPPFPTLHPDHSWVMIGTEGDPEWLNLIETLFTDLLRTPKYRPNERCFGYAMGGRRASPLIAQMRKIGNRYYPVLTIMRSKPDRDINWEVLNDFMDDAARLWDGINVWGGPLK